MLTWPRCQLEWESNLVRIAYLTNAYPAVSHTFIRRELNQLEREVGEIARFSIRRPPFKIVDADDVCEEAKTFYVLHQTLAKWVSAAVKCSLGHPINACKGLRTALALGFRSHAGMAKHLAYFAEALLLLDETRCRKIEHVHVHFGTNPTAVALIMRAMGGPSYSFTVHGPDELDAPVSLKLGRKIEQSAFVVAVSDFCAAQLRRWIEHQHWDKIRVVRCTVGEDFLEQSEQAAPNSRSLVCVGRLSPQKGQLLLVEGFSRAVDSGIDANLVLAGDGEMRGPIEALIRRKRLQGRVRITGWIGGDQVRREILNSRALVLSSFAEGLPVVIMEALALGRPVLATSVAGIPELIVAGENGWLIPAGSVSAISEGIRAVMETPMHRLKQMGERGRVAVRARHYTPTEAAKLAEYIRQSVKHVTNREASA